MIKVKTIEAGSLGGRIVMLVADTKAEVPETGTATVAAMPAPLTGSLSMGDVIFTTDRYFGVLKSDDTWNWGD